MKGSKDLLATHALALGVSLLCVVLLLISTWVYTYAMLRLARLEGVYPSAREGMLIQINRNDVPPYEVLIAHAGTNAFDGSNLHV